MAPESAQTPPKSERNTTSSEARDIQERLRRAFMTLRALPSSAHTTPMGHKSAWPDMIRPAKRGAILKRGTIGFRPNNEDISDCYMIIDALYSLSEMQRILLSGRAMNVPWRQFQNRFHRSRTHLNRLYNLALQALEERIECQ